MSKTNTDGEQVLRVVCMYDDAAGEKRRRVGGGRGGLYMFSDQYGACAAVLCGCAGAGCDA